MNLGKIIDEMARQGFECHVGPHQKDLIGYFAVFYCPHTVERCDECEEAPITWQQCGHGHTPIQAIRQARAIALNQPVIHPEPDDFHK